MPSDRADMIRLLELELDFIEGGGYGKPAGKPTEDKPMFYHSPACINSWSVPGHGEDCHDDCVLLDAVPQGDREHKLPCHFIPLTESGETLQSLEGKADREQIEEAVKGWLRRTIEQLKTGAGAAGPEEVKY